jgi:hypothetical protein
MCEASAVEVLSLNGLGAAGGCAKKTQLPLSGVMLFNTIGGTLPECVWHLKNLNVLHAVGNGLTGELIGVLPNTSRLTDVSLSHNRFSGTVPVGVQTLYNIDLSNNRISGQFDANSGPWLQQDVNLEINRISGRLPVANLQNVSELKVLRGNMISCNTIPANDEYEADYICESVDLDESHAVFVIALATVFCIILIVLILSRLHVNWNVVAQVRRLLIYVVHGGTHGDVGCGPHSQPIRVMCTKFRANSRFFVQLLLFMLLISVPVYVVRGGGYDGVAWSTHENTYAWFWTFAYMRGTVPAALILVAWGGSLTAFYCHIWITPFEDDVGAEAISWSPGRGKDDENKDDGDEEGQIIKDKTLTSRDVSERNKLHRQTSMKNTSSIKAQSDVNVDVNHEGKKLAAVLALLFNTIVSILINTLYIVSIQKPLTPLVHFGFQVSLASFRLLYSFYVTPKLASVYTNLVVNIRFRGRLQLISNLIVPCLVTLFASPSCFQVRIGARLHHCLGSGIVKPFKIFYLHSSMQWL